MIGWWQFGHRWFLVQWQFIIWPFYLYPLGLNLFWNEFYYGFWHLQCLIVGWFGVWFRKFCASDWQKQIFGCWYWKMFGWMKKGWITLISLKVSRNDAPFPQFYSKWHSPPWDLWERNTVLSQRQQIIQFFFNEDSLWCNHGQSSNFLG